MVQTVCRMKIVYTPSAPSMIHKSLAETSTGAHRYPHEKLRCSHGCRGSEGEVGDARVPIGIDNPNFSVINRSSVHGTWCTKSLRASDVIGIYWPENWDALSPPELHVPSFLIFLPRFLPAPPVSAKPPFYIHSLFLFPLLLLHSISLFLAACHVVRPSESICLFRGIRYLYTGCRRKCEMSF